MKTKIFLLTVICCLALSVKAQRSLITTSDSNFLIHDYIPDTVLNYNSATGFRDSLRLDINQDGLFDIRFYYVPTSGGYYPNISNMTANCRYHYFLLTDTTSLNNSSVLWLSGSDFWNPYDFPEIYLGVKIIDGVNNFYGWIRASNPWTIMSIDKYAFCKIPNYPLHLGQEEIVGIEENNLLNTANIFLSNSGNSIIVNADKSIKSVSIFNTSGAIVASQSNIGANSADINIANLAHGSYLVNVLFSDLRSYTRQVVK